MRACIFDFLGFVTGIGANENVTHSMFCFAVFLLRLNYSGTERFEVPRGFTLGKLSPRLPRGAYTTKPVATEAAERPALLGRTPAYPVRSELVRHHPGLSLGFVPGG